MMIEEEFEILGNREFDYDEEVMIWWTVDKLGGFTGKIIDIKLEEQSEFWPPLYAPEIIYLIRFFDPTKEDEWVDESLITSKPIITSEPMEEQ